MKKLQSLFLVTILITTMFVINVSADSDENIFVDFDKISYWAKDGVQDAYERDLMKGQYDKQNQLYFNPQGNVTFAEAFAMVMNFINNQKLDVKENIEKLDYPSVNLWVDVEYWGRAGQGCYYEIQLENKYDDVNLVRHCMNPIQVQIPYYYAVISHNDGLSTPDEVLKYWNRTAREIASDYAKKSKEEQLEYCFQEDFKRINEEKNEELKTVLKKGMMFRNYRYRLEAEEAEIPVLGMKYNIENTVEERHAIQLKYINPGFYPNLQNKNHWGYNTYEELMKYMYLNGMINEEDISLDTPIRKDQFASLMYWVLAISGQTYDWSGAPQFAVGKALEKLTVKEFEEFVNLPKNVEYVYAGPLNQLKELEIMIGEGGNTIQYNSNITREQAAIVVNKVYEYASNHNKMKRYYTDPNVKNIPWYRAPAGFAQLDKNLFPYQRYYSPNNMVKGIIFKKYGNEWIAD